jgi:hypothetical protein
MGWILSKTINLKTCNNSSVKILGNKMLPQNKPGRY